MAIALDEDDAVGVGAHPREDVLLAHGAAQQGADLDQHLVGGVQAGAVVELAEAVDVDEGDGQRAVVALGARDLLGQALAEGAVVGQAGERVGRRLGVEPRAILGVGHGGGDEVGVVVQALLGAGRELVRLGGHRRRARPTARRRCAPARPGACSGARRPAGRARWPRRTRRRSSRLPGTHVDGGVGIVGPVLVVGPAAEHGHAVGVLEADDGGAVGAQQAPGVRARRARRCRSAGSRRRPRSPRAAARPAPRPSAAARPRARAPGAVRRPAARARRRRRRRPGSRSARRRRARARGCPRWRAPS